jgi:peptidoglycan hydrolase CwlO-like protein
MTNIILWVVAVKIALVQQVALPDLGALLLALLSYSHKRHVSNNAAKHASETQAAETEAINNKLQEAQHNLEQLSGSLMELHNKQKEDSKVISEAKSLLTASRLNGAMSRNQ